MPCLDTEGRGVSPGGRAAWGACATLALLSVALGLSVPDCSPGQLQHSQSESGPSKDAGVMMTHVTATLLSQPTPCRGSSHQVTQLDRAHVDQGHTTVFLQLEKHVSREWIYEVSRAPNSGQPPCFCR